MRRLKSVALFAFLAFVVGCKSPTPPSPPALHGAIVTITAGGSFDHFVVYRGTSCTSTMAIATIKTLTFTDKTAPAGANCYGVAQVGADGSSLRSNFMAVTVPESGAVTVKLDSRTKPQWAKK